ncbi:MAG: C1 family peptidase [Bacteroidota bacterium]|jgi:C1A family cysteine protease
MESQTPDQNSHDNVAQLRKENKALRLKLNEFTDLQEDLIAARVFEKAKKRLVAWYTFGGFILFAVGLWGVKTVVDYTKDVAKEKLSEVTEEQAKSIIETESQVLVSAFLDKQQDTLMKNIQLFAQQKISEIIVANSPLRGNTFNDHADTSQSGNDKVTVDLSPQMNPVRNQGNEGSTVGFALTAVLELEVYYKYNKKVMLSPRFVYNNINHQIDGGASIPDALNFLQKEGVVEESIWPYKAGEYQELPTKTISEAKHYKIDAWRSINLQVSEIQAQLNAGYPVVAGILVYESFRTPIDGIISNPSITERALGGQAICIVGYDRHRKLFKIRNSWGAGWGINGYAYLPYSSMKPMIKEAYVFRLE